MSAPRYRILLVDDHPLVRRGLRQFIELDRGLEIVGEASDGESALPLQAQVAPDLILLDSNMPGMGGIETLQRLRRAGFAGKVLLFTVADGAEDVRAALHAGADGYLLKDTEPEDLVLHLRRVLRGERVLSARLEAMLE